jgi:hypothetical protein
VGNRGARTHEWMSPVAVVLMAGVALAACGGGGGGAQTSTTKVKVVGACKYLDEWQAKNGHSPTPSDVDAWFRTLPNGPQRAAAIDEVGANCRHYMPGVTTLPERPLATPPPP